MKKVIDKINSASWFDVDKVERQYRTCIHDSSLDFTFTDMCHRNITKFLLTLVEGEEYRE
jgi:hypothetical protein